MMIDRTTHLLLALRQRATLPERDERGDVPGWVMVTVMTAAVVAVLIPVVKEQLGTLLDNALQMVTSGADA